MVHLATKPVFSKIDTKSGGLSRVLNHLDNEFGVVSAYRDINTDNDNLALHSKLKKDIRSLGFGFIELASSWEENGEVSKEQSLFIPNISLKEIVSLGNKYVQYSVLYGNSGTVNHICTFAEYCGSVGKVLDTFTKSNISESDFKGAFSQLKKGGKNARVKKFQLSGIEEVHRPHGLPIKDKALEK